LHNRQMVHCPTGQEAALQAGETFRGHRGRLLFHFTILYRRAGLGHSPRGPARSPSEAGDEHVAIVTDLDPWGLSTVG